MARRTTPRSTDDDMPVGGVVAPGAMHDAHISRLTLLGRILPAYAGKSCPGRPRQRRHDDDEAAGALEE